MAIDPKQAQVLFLEAVQKPVEERAAFVAQACGSDEELRIRVEALLRANDDPLSFLNSHDAVTGAFIPSESNASSLPSKADGVGSVIAGRYKLIEAIGEGGMGSVFMAQQTEPVKRAVAVKVIKAGMDSKGVLARFEAERQALAMMDHPNIAKVLDGGVTDSGSPYFVMELVKGVPITKFCDDRKLSPRQRLELFVPVCLAIQHAHQKGIIHRDIKPSNVLVAMYDDRPVPKVIDFGVAKAAGSPLTDQTMMTGFGAVVGTPEYMSPEQASFNQMDVDTRSDVYALGVLLYELLTGTTPVDRKTLGKAALLEVLRIVREVEAPSPSHRLSTTETLPSVAANRNIEPAKLSKLLKGELDWILMKALEKDRTRRYDTANALAQDVQRYLADEVVEARAPSTSYRLRKYVKRHRVQVIAASVVMLAFLVGIVGTAWGLVEARKQRDVAENARRAEAEQRADAEKQTTIALTNERIAGEQKAIATKAQDRAETALYFNGINLAHQYWIGNNLSQFNRILDACPNERRCWEWNYLHRLLHSDLQTLPGNGQYTTAIQFSRDGKRMATFSQWGDSGARIWDLNTNKPISEIQWSKTAQHYVCSALNPDGRTLALCDKTGAVTFWDVDSGKLTREFKRFPRAIKQLTFSPDGRWLAATQADFRNDDLTVWDSMSGQEVFHLKGFGAIVLFSPDGSNLLTFKKNQRLRLSPKDPEYFVSLIATADWKERELNTLGAATSFSFSSDGKQLALGGRDPKTDSAVVRFLDVETGKELSSIAPRAVENIELSPDGKTLALTSGFGTTEIEIWDIKSRRVLRTLRAHTEWINCMAFAPDGRLISGSSDRTIKFWDPNVNQEVARITKSLPVLSATPSALSSNGALSAFGQRGSVNILTGSIRTITLIDVETGSVRHKLKGHSGGPNVLAFSANGTRLASGGDSEAKIWDSATGAELCTYRGHNGLMVAVAISPDGRWAASAHEPKEITEARSGRGQLKNIPVSVKVWDAQTGKERWELKGHPAGVYQVAFSPNGRYLATEGYREKYSPTESYHRIKLWDMDTGTQMRELEPSPQISGNDFLAFSPSGEFLIFAGGNAVQFFSTATGQSAGLIQGLRTSLRGGLAISPDQTRLASASGLEVKLWDMKSGQEILTLPLPESTDKDRKPSVSALAWSSDNQRLRAALTDGSVVEWNGTPTLAK